MKISNTVKFVCLALIFSILLLSNSLALENSTFENIINYDLGDSGELLENFSSITHINTNIIRGDTQIIDDSIYLDYFNSIQKPSLLIIFYPDTLRIVYHYSPSTDVSENTMASFISHMSHDISLGNNPNDVFNEFFTIFINDYISLNTDESKIVIPNTSNNASTFTLSNYFSRSNTIIFLIVLIVLSVLFVLLFIQHNRHHLKHQDYADKLKNYVFKLKEMGYDRNTINNYLLKEGHDEETVKSILDSLF